MRQKIRYLKLEVVGFKRGYKTTTSIVMPHELPSVEEELKLLAAILGLSGTVPWYFCGAESMTKGKPWSVEEEKQLRELVLAHRPLGVIVG